MKKRIILIAVVIAVAALAAAPLVLAGPGGRHGFGRQGFAGHHGGMAMFGHLRHLKEELDLSDGQVAQIKGIFADAHEQNEQYREQLHGGFMDVAAALLANPNDIAGAQAILDQRAAAERAMKTSLLQATSKAIGVLNPAQRTRLANHIAERAANRERRGR